MLVSSVYQSDSLIYIYHYTSAIISLNQQVNQNKNGIVGEIQPFIQQQRLH